MEIRENFSFASPVEVISALKVYTSSFYGSMLWDLRGEGATKVYNCWNTAVKLAWHVPRATRTFLLQQVLTAGFPSARVDILARFGNFFRSLRMSPCMEVSVLANIVGRDVRTTTGSNLRLLEELTGLDPWLYGSARIKEELFKQELVETPDTDKWRAPFLSKLLEQKQQSYYLGDLEATNNLTILIESLCVN